MINQLVVSPVCYMMQGSYIDDIAKKRQSKGIYQMSIVIAELAREDALSKEEVLRMLDEVRILIENVEEGE